MKKRIIQFIGVLAFGFLANSANAQEISFEKTTHNFGKVERGPKVYYEFMFINTGDKPLIIDHVDKTCGCTTPEWTTDPVMPGDTGYIKFGFDTDRPAGGFAKGLTVHSNAVNKPEQSLIFEGEIIDTKSGVDTTPKMEDH